MNGLDRTMGVNVFFPELNEDGLGPNVGYNVSFGTSSVNSEAPNSVKKDGEFCWGKPQIRPVTRGSAVVQVVGP